MHVDFTWNVRVWRLQAYIHTSTNHRHFMAVTENKKWLRVHNLLIVIVIYRLARGLCNVYMLSLCCYSRVCIPSFKTAISWVSIVVVTWLYFRRPLHVVRHQHCIVRRYNSVLPPEWELHHIWWVHGVGYAFPINAGKSELCHPTIDHLTNAGHTTYYHEDHRHSSKETSALIFIRIG